MVFWGPEGRLKGILREKDEKHALVGFIQYNGGSAILNRDRFLN